MRFEKHLLFRPESRLSIVDPSHHQPHFMTVLLQDMTQVYYGTWTHRSRKLIAHGSGVINNVHTRGDVTFSVSLSPPMAFIPKMEATELLLLAALN